MISIDDPDSTTSPFGDQGDFPSGLRWPTFIAPAEPPSFNLRAYFTLTLGRFSVFIADEACNSSPIYFEESDSTVIPAKLGLFDAPTGGNVEGILDFDSVAMSDERCAYFIPAEGLCLKFSADPESKPRSLEAIGNFIDRTMYLELQDEMGDPVSGVSRIAMNKNDWQLK